MSANPVVIIQARMGSTRLPGKTMMEIAGRRLIDWVLDGARAIKNARGIIVAIPENPEDDPLEAYLNERGVSCFRGSSEDVLDRFYRAALEAKADPVIRLCADSPLPSAEYMDMMIETHLKTGADHTHNDGLFPLGSYGEVVSFTTLERMWREAKTVHCREHVTPFIHENPQSFRVNRVQAPAWMQRDYRLTIDTAKDREMMETLFRAMMDQGLPVNFTNAMAVLEARPEIAAINSTVPQKDWRKGE
ncbi:MAG: glycosyltransferase family protein [Nitrospinae bacterium]|nr:glycosyltransferase family protein [Nitrospinota bacterium]